LLVIGANSAKEWIDIFKRVSITNNIDIKMVEEELDSSDQVSFHEKGIPAVQLFTGPHIDYHRPTDAVDKIDPDGLLKIASVAKEVIEYLSKREKPFTATLTPVSQSYKPSHKEKRVSLGVVPDFSYNLKGVRLSGVVPGSPAESCGMREGDVIIKINTNPIVSLKDLSLNLKSLNHGDRISITYIRNGEEKTIETEVIQR
jgi:C-terminal processing protease CtpA/Prc